MNALAPGDRLGDYVVEALLGQGSASTLYRVVPAGGLAAQELLLKVAQADDPQAAALLHHEVEHQVLPLLQGPHVPRCLASGGLPQQPWLVMTQEPGRLLQDWLDAPALPDVGEVLCLGVALARAVHALHRQGVVHHDLQPQHVLLREDGSVVLLGWGCAFHARLPDLLAGAPVTAGPAAVPAPEERLGQRGDPRSDIHAIGVLLHRLLTGAAPAPSARDPLRRAWLPSLATRQPPLTPWLQAVLRRCLDPVAAQRYPTAAHLAFDLLHPQPGAEPAHTPAEWLRELGQRLRFGLRAAGVLPAPPGLRPAVPHVPIVMLVVPEGALAEAPPVFVRRAVAHALGPHPLARLLCVRVLAPPSADAPCDDAHRQLARLRRWARPLGRAGSEAVCELLPAANAAEALCAHAVRLDVSEIVLDVPAAGVELAAALARSAPCSTLLLRG